MAPPSLNQSQKDELKLELSEWRIARQDGTQSLQRTFTFENFTQALEFTLRVGDLAEEQKYYPKLVTEHGRVTVYWQTDNHIKSLHQTDFIMAAKTDYLYQRGKAIWMARRKR